jgi:hypothetical protein
MARPYTRLEEDEVWGALEDHDGSVLSASRQLGCSDRAIYYWIDRDEDSKARFKEMREAARRARLDKAEDVVAMHVQDMDLKAATFELRQRGRDRGYGNKLEVGGTPGQPIQHSIEGLSELSPRDLVEAYREMIRGSSGNNSR